MKEARKPSNLPENIIQIPINSESTVLRDKSGRIHWVIRDASPEENEQLAIRNMQGLFLEKFPEFNDLFPRDAEGKVAEEKREEAGKFILGNVLNRKNFLLTFPAAPTDARRVPVFEGLSMLAISRAFTPWDIDFGSEFNTYLQKKRSLIGEMEKEAKIFVASYGNMSVSLLNQHGHFFAVLDIDKIQGSYPGGLEALKRKVGIEKDRNDNRTIESIEEEVSEFLRTHDNQISKRLLIEDDQSGLWHAIYHKYPGRIAGIRAKFGLVAKRKPRNYWIPENIEAEFGAFIEEHGNATYELLEKYDRHDLALVVVKYPGGINTLKQKFGIEVQVRMTTEEANAQLKKLLEAGEEDIVISRSTVEKIVSLKPGDPGYRSFQEIYRASDSFEEKAALAKALINDGGYQDLRFLVRAFIPYRAVDNERAEELRKNIESEVRIALLYRGDGREKKKAERELNIFAHDVVQGESVDAQTFNQLVGLFGSSNIVDILYRSRPEFRGLPIDKVKSILGEYLGDFLIVKRAFNPDDLEYGIDYLSDPELKEGLMEVIKESALAVCLQERRDSDLSDQDIISTYLRGVSSEVSKFRNDELNSVIEEVESYYRGIFEYVKPSTLVDYLRPGRTFPDLGQLINIKELADKKRVLIADDMGLGKSASAILAKESLGLRQALVVVPSNVVPVWQDYLSDKVAEDGKKIGYFKPGQAPRVLTIESVDVLGDQDTLSYSYVLVSQEKLTDRNISELEKLDFDMLIVDEIHKLKNVRYGVRAANLIRLSQKVEEDGYLALLSGTPIPNKVEDVAMVLKLLYPEKFRDVKGEDLVRSIISGDYIDLRRLLIPRMQTKSLTESIDMPNLTEEIEWVHLSQQERDVYEVLLEEDEIEATEKIRILRQFLLNPELLDSTPGIKSSKIAAVAQYLQYAFNESDKIVLFVNGYIENVIRGDKSILEQLGLPEEIEVRVIHGKVESRRQRKVIQDGFKTSNGKILLLVSGQTADVGVDFSGADEVTFYNHPWTRYDQKQQLARAYREGLEHPLKSTTFVTENTIEDGIRHYIELKYKAIQKLLKGIPISQVERGLLEKSDDDIQDLEVNPELAKYYLSSWERMLKIFAYVKEIGEDEFVSFLARYGKDYSDSYADLGRRSYQANASRVSGVVIHKLTQRGSQAAQDIKILDLASGPQMLKRHMPQSYGSGIISVDINKNHFSKEKDGSVVGSFTSIPVQDGTVDYVNLGLSLHYTKFIPSRGNYERLEVLREINRVLKPGGKAVLNLIYTLDLKDVQKFQGVAASLGFRMLDEYSGEVITGDNYRSRVITLEKENDIDQPSESLVSRDNYDGIKFKKTNLGLKDSRRILRELRLSDNNFQIEFNQQDQQVAQEEIEVMAEGEMLKAMYGSIDNIPKEEIISRNFVRILIGKRYVLFKKLVRGEGVVVLK